jgi:steroid 5-alpha reductase family enzyme
MIPIYIQGLILILGLMTTLWIVSVILKNVSIVDIFWGLGFVLVNTFYFFNTEASPAKTILLLLVAVWGLRLSVYLAWRNIGKPEDFRYQEFRKKYGESRYWWISFFQTFMLQGILMFIISLPLLGVNLYSTSQHLTVLDYLGILIWTVGFIFEAGGDMQLAQFKKNKANKGKVLNTGFWHYTRHPNYFGDSAVWWGYGLFCLSTGSYWYVAGSVIMTLLIIKVSGVALLEKSLKDQKPEYKKYISETSSFIPWFPKK